MCQEVRCSIRTVPANSLGTNNGTRHVLSASRRVARWRADEAGEVPQLSAVEVHHVERGIPCLRGEVDRRRASAGSAGSGARRLTRAGDPCGQRSANLGTAEVSVPYRIVQPWGKRAGEWTLIDTRSTVGDAFAALDAHEGVIERGLQTFYAVGAALLAIRDTRLYRANYETFEQYCFQRWSIKRSRAYELMEAAGVIENVGNLLQPPTTESHAAALVPLSPEAQRVAWGMAVDTAPDGKI